jgi:hypothetical protein
MSHLRLAQGTTMFPVHAVRMQLILYLFLDDQIQLYGFFLYHSHLFSFIFNLTSHFPSFAYFHSGDGSNMFF